MQPWFRGWPVRWSWALLWALLGLALAGPVAASPDTPLPALAEVHVTAALLNVRAAPSTNAAIVGRLRAGDISGNPLLMDLPGNVGLGHADLVVLDGKTLLFTSLDGVRQARLGLVWATPK